MKLKAKGFLFDLDGTLADSLAVVERCWCKFGERIGKSADEVISYIHGKPAMTSLRHFLPEASDEEIMGYFRWLEKMESEDVEGVVALPGAIALLSRLMKSGLRGPLLPLVQCQLHMVVSKRQAYQNLSTG